TNFPPPPPPPPPPPLPSFLPRPPSAAAPRPFPSNFLPSRAHHARTGSSLQPSPTVSKPISLPPPPPPEPPKCYLLPPPPPWPPACLEYSPGKDFKVLFDPFTDKGRDGRFAALIEKVQEASLDNGEDARIKGKNKGKETLTRYQGEVVGGEPEPVVRDPWKVEEFRKPMVARPMRTGLYEIKYEYDSNSTGPPPPTAILVTNVLPLMPNQEIRRHFSKYGPILTFDPPNRQNDRWGAGYRVHQVQHTRRGEALNGKMGISGEGKKLKAILRELDDRRRRECEAKWWKEQEEKDREAAARATAKVPPGHVSSLTSP
ncbi:hypothetical protein EW146_g1253, partial [Bondarzewia mesenterica]